MARSIRTVRPGSAGRPLSDSAARTVQPQGLAKFNKKHFGSTNKQERTAFDGAGGGTDQDRIRVTVGEGDKRGEG